MPIFYTKTHSDSIVSNDNSVFDLQTNAQQINNL